MKLNYLLMVCLIFVSYYALASSLNNNRSRKTKRSKSPLNANRFPRNGNTFHAPPAIIHIDDESVPFDLSHTRPQDILGPKRHIIALTCYENESHSCRKTIKTTGKLCYLSHMQCRKHMAYQRTFVFYNEAERLCEMNRFPGPTNNFLSLDECHQKMGFPISGRISPDHFVYDPDHGQCVLAHSGNSKLKSVYGSKAVCTAINIPRYCSSQSIPHCYGEPGSRRGRFCFPKKSMCEKFKYHYRNLYFLSDDQTCQKVGDNLRLNWKNKLYSTLDKCYSTKFSPTNDRSSNGITPRPAWQNTPATVPFAMRPSPATNVWLTKPPYAMIPATNRIITSKTTTTQLTTTQPRTTSKTSPITTTKRTTTTTTPTTTTTRTIPTTKRRITLAEANDLAHRCCISSGISEKCAAKLCRYNARSADNENAYSPWIVGGMSCDVQLMKDHLICMTNGKNNLQCCKDRDALPEEDCHAFCDPLGYPQNDWPTTIYGAQKFKICKTGKTHSLRYQCHLDYSYL